MIGRVVVLAGAHGLSGPVDQEMMDQVAAAEGREFVTVQKPVKAVAGKFRHHDRVHQRRDDSHKGDVQARVKHGCFSFHFSLRFPKQKGKPPLSSHYEVSRRSSSDKERQAAPEQRMSHDVVLGSTYSVESKGLAERETG